MRDLGERGRWVGQDKGSELVEEMGGGKGGVGTRDRVGTSGINVS